jgi:hypothetical protein
MVISFADGLCVVLTKPAMKIEVFREIFLGCLGRSKGISYIKPSDIKIYMS